MAGDLVTIKGVKELNRKLENMMDKLPGSAAFVFGKEGQRVAGNIQDAIQAAPRVDTGALRSGIHERTKKTRTGAETVIRPSDTTDKYAIFVERDTRPHWPPIAAITPWARRHGIEPFLVAKAISEKGTKGIHMFENEFKALARRGDKVANDLGIQMIGNFKRG